MNSVTVKTRIANAKETERPRSEVHRQTVRQAGAIRRISVAVLVDGISSEGPDGEAVWEARSGEELTALRELVSAAIGFDEARGDIVTVESMAFQPDATPGSLVEISPWFRFFERNAMTLIQIGALSIVALVLALTVLRPILTRPASAGAIASPSTVTAELAGPAGAQQAAQAGLPAPADTTDEADADGEALRQAIAERPEETVSMLQDWLSPTELAVAEREVA
jgi:flagellar M-ring protein FliF